MTCRLQYKVVNIYLMTRSCNISTSKVGDHSYFVFRSNEPNSDVVNPLELKFYFLY